MFLSTIIPTIGRQTLTHAVESILNQKFEDEDFEVIVVNDSGSSLPDSDWQHSEKVQIIHTNRHNRSVARNTGAAIAKGKYFHFLDDDDWMAPDAFNRFWNLSKNSDAAWIYGSFTVVNNASEVVTTIKPRDTGNCFVQALASEWLPLQASLISSKAFFKIGGFASLNSLLGGYEDIDLFRQIARYYEIAGMVHVVVNIRAGDRQSTTDYANMLNQNRRSRERALDMPGAFNRLCTSARGNKDNAAYWHGRIVYYYLASLKLNLHNKCVFTTASRGIYALAGLISARQCIFMPGFWRGIVKPHYNQVRLTIDNLDFKWF
jgi:glycosyltransferase involved in cell wall biosynthesis